MPIDCPHHPTLRLEPTVCAVRQAKARRTALSDLALTYHPCRTCEMATPALPAVSGPERDAEHYRRIAGDAWRAKAAPAMARLLSAMRCRQAATVAALANDTGSTISATRARLYRLRAAGQVTSDTAGAVTVWRLSGSFQSPAHRGRDERGNSLGMGGREG